MKRNYWDLFWALVGVFIVTINLSMGKDTKNFFGIEMNAWIYRAIWIIFAIVNFRKFLYPKQTEE